MVAALGQSVYEYVKHPRVELETMSDFRPDGRSRRPALVLGYDQMPEPAIRAGVRELVEAIQAARNRGPG